MANALTKHYKILNEFQEYAVSLRKFRGPERISSKAIISEMLQMRKLMWWVEGVNPRGSEPRTDNNRVKRVMPPHYRFS